MREAPSALRGWVVQKKQLGDQNSTMTRSVRVSVWIGKVLVRWYGALFLKNAGLSATENIVKVQPLSEPDEDQTSCLR